METIFQDLISRTEAQPGVVHTVSYFCDVLQRQADGTDNSWPLLVTVDPEKQQVDDFVRLNKVLV